MSKPPKDTSADDYRGPPVLGSGSAFDATSGKNPNHRKYPGPKSIVAGVPHDSKPPKG